MVPEPAWLRVTVARTWRLAAAPFSGRPASSTLLLLDPTPLKHTPLGGLQRLDVPHALLEQPPASETAILQSPDPWPLRQGFSHRIASPSGLTTALNQALRRAWLDD